MSNTETKVMAEEAEHVSSSIRASVSLPPLNPQGREVGGGGLGLGTLVNPWLIHVNVWQKPL